MNSFSALLLIHLDRVSDAYFEKEVVQSDEVQQRCHQNTKRLIYSDTPNILYLRIKHQHPKWKEAVVWYTNVVN